MWFAFLYVYGPKFLECRTGCGFGQFVSCMYPCHGWLCVVCVYPACGLGVRLSLCSFCRVISVELHG
jgi:hypothetical protein